MRLPRVRFTVRRMTISLATVTITMFSFSRWYDLHSKARANAWWVIYAANIKGAKGERLASHYRMLKLKYERAAWYPWLAVAPDPPEPK